MVYEWGVKRRRRGQRMSWKQNLHQTVRNPNITKEDVQDRDRLRTIYHQWTILGWKKVLCSENSVSFNLYYYYYCSHYYL